MKKLLLPVLAFALPGATLANGLLGVDFSAAGFYSIDETTAAQTFLTTISVGAGWGALEYDAKGTLYGVTSGASSKLYTINIGASSATEVGLLDPTNDRFHFEGGLAIGTTNAFFVNGVSAGAAELYTINLATGTASLVGVMGERDINGLAFRPDGSLVGLDRVSNSLVVIDPITAAVSTLAPLRPTVGNVGGMTVLGGLGYFNTSGPSNGSNELYSFDLTTGAHTLVGGYTTGDAGISGLAAMQPVPEPATLAVLGLGLIALRRRRA